MTSFLGALDTVGEAPWDPPTQPVGANSARGDYAVIGSIVLAYSQSEWLGRWAGLNGACVPNGGDLRVNVQEDRHLAPLDKVHVEGHCT